MPGTRGDRSCPKRVVNTDGGACRARGAGAPSSRRSAPQRGHSPAPRCPVKPPPMHLNRRLSHTQRAHPKPCDRIRTQYGTPRRTAPTKRNLDAENPHRPVANYSTAGVSRTLPCGCILNNSIYSGSLGSPYGAPSRHLLCFTAAEESPGTYSFHKLHP